MLLQSIQALGLKKLQGSNTGFSYQLCAMYLTTFINPFSTNFTKWSNTLKQLIGNLLTNCLSVFDHFVRNSLVHRSWIDHIHFYLCLGNGFEKWLPKLSSFNRDFSKHFLPLLYGGKNSILNRVFKLNPLRGFFY